MEAHFPIDAHRQERDIFLVAVRGAVSKKQRRIARSGRLGIAEIESRSPPAGQIT